jgi:hypothetical protein
VTVELESLRRRHEVETFVQFLPHVAFLGLPAFPRPISDLAQWLIIALRKLAQLGIEVFPSCLKRGFP